MMCMDACLCNEVGLTQGSHEDQSAEEEQNVSKVERQRIWDLGSVLI
jgi:hypothetical protein